MLILVNESLMKNLTISAPASFPPSPEPAPSSRNFLFSLWLRVLSGGGVSRAPGAVQLSMEPSAHVPGLPVALAAAERPTTAATPARLRRPAVVLAPLHIFVEALRSLLHRPA